MNKARKDFLLEINTEELPSGYIEKAISYLEGSFNDALRFNYGLIDGAIEPRYLATKNSLIVYIKNIAIKQSMAKQEIVGPPKHIAFDENGKPAKAVISFANKLGVEVEDLKIKSTPKGDYVVAVKIDKACNTKDILRDIIPSIIRNTPFPKTMRWDNSDVRFARPIESIVALFGDENIPVEMGNISQKKLTSMTPEEYINQRRKHVEIDFKKRKDKIKKLILDALKKDAANAYKSIDEDLLDEVNFLVSVPCVFVGEFNEGFLSLPEDVLKASMSKYQRIFPVFKGTHLINKFIAVIDGSGRDIENIREHYECILEARLKDSLFFFNEDMKRPLSANVSKLKDLIFQKDLGNMFEKIQRLKGLCSFICENTGLGQLKNDLLRAAELSKADLVTHMIGEFPSLQGVMGKEYALRSKEPSGVATAIREHYLPQRADDALPRSIAGAILSISDKIDNVVGFLGMGAEISGSFDPYGIKRNTQGIIQIIKDKAFRLDVNSLIGKSIELYRGRLKYSPDELTAKINNYIKERMESLMEPQAVLQFGLKEAVLAVNSNDIVDVFNRIEKLSLMVANKSKKIYFLQAAKVVERTSNILKGAKGEKIGDVNEGLFKEDLERGVWKAYLDSKDKIKNLIDAEKYEEATERYGHTFFEILHEFFDKVLVNTEEEALRMNRLAMMKAINVLYTERVADLAKLPQIVVK